MDTNDEEYLRKQRARFEAQKQQNAMHHEQYKKHTMESDNAFSKNLHSMTAHNEEIYMTEIIAKMDNNEDPSSPTMTHTKSKSRPPPSDPVPMEPQLSTGLSLKERVMRFTRPIGKSLSNTLSKSPRPKSPLPLNAVPSGSLEIELNESNGLPTTPFKLTPAIDAIAAANSALGAPMPSASFEDEPALPQTVRGPIRGSMYDQLTRNDDDDDDSDSSDIHTDAMCDDDDDDDINDSELDALAEATEDEVPFQISNDVVVDVRGRKDDIMKGGIQETYTKKKRERTKQLRQKSRNQLIKSKVVTDKRKIWEKRHNAEE